MGWLVRFRRFLTEVWAELKKTTWPPRREVYGTTMVVIVAVLLSAAYLYVVDMILKSGMDQLFRAFQ